MASAALVARAYLITSPSPPIYREQNMKYPRKLERSELTGALHEATEAELLALAELSEWMTKHQLVLATRRAHGIRIGATREVRQYMLDSTDPEFAGMVAGNIEPLPRAGM